ncbi:MAG: NADH-quinone oxidoreductase subunit NuoE [Candidatus Zixiibacteriota bacterium]|nr:MAG: NADH-quinone oxidoreductase subunit NuoE [candidate division Zixibacteria bacterium]
MTTIKVEKSYDVKDAIDKIIKKYNYKPTALIMIMQDVQSHYKYLPKEALELISKKMKLPMAQIYGVATFYKTFSLEPKGKNHICVCTGTACHVRQASIIIDKLERDLNISVGETTEDGEFSIETVNCLGACALGPLVTANEEYYGNMTVAKIDKMMEDLKKPKVNKVKREEVV